jgi:hypothetical protein
MVKHGAISRAHVYRMVGSEDARVRAAAFTLLEASNPRLRKDSDLFMEITRFIWDANPSYDVYREFSKRHLFVGYKVHELISARIKLEKQSQQSASTDRRTGDVCQEGFFERLRNEIASKLSFFSRKLKRPHNITRESKYRASTGRGSVTPRF